MSVEDFLARLQERHGLTKLCDAQGQSIICTDANHTHFEIPDPVHVPAASRALLLDIISANLATYALGY